MKRYLQGRVSLFYALLVIGIVILLVVMSWPFIQRTRIKVPPGPTTTHETKPRLGTLISRDVPAFSAPNPQTPDSTANDKDYNSSWRSNGIPTWLAYDLSGAPTSTRKKVLVVWYNETGNYDHTLIGDAAYNMPQDYTIDINTTQKGTSPPETGWKTVVTVKANHYHSRQHIIDMTGYNWLRISVTAIDGSPMNEDANINLDVYDASYATSNNWIFFGDSITAGSMGHETITDVPAFAQLINAHSPNHFPVQENGGIGYMASTDAAPHIKNWLSLFPGKYVTLNYGSGDTSNCANPDTFYQNYVAMVQDVLQTNKIPVIPHIPWGRTSNHQNCTPALNAKIDALYQAFPQIIHGPDLWAFFKSHQDLISPDGVHPTTAGYAAYRQQWADAMLKSGLFA